MKTNLPRDPWQVTAALALGIVTAWRLAGLGARGLWFDEAFSWQITRFPWGEMIARARQDVHPPLYYVELKLWTGMFGDSVSAMRLLSVAWFAAALAGAFLLCQEGAIALGGEARKPDPPQARDAGLMAMLMLAASPFLYRYSLEIRMYSEVVALVILSSWLLLRALREAARPRSWWFAYAVAATALAYSHYIGLFSLAAQAGFAAVTLAVKRPEGLRRGPAAWRASAAALAVAVSFLPWAPTVLHQRAQVAEDYWLEKPDSKSPIDWESWRNVVRKSLAPWDTAPHGKTPLTERLFLDGLIAASALVLLLLARPGGRLGWCLVAGILIPIGLGILSSHLAGRTLLVPRYFLPQASLLLIGLAVVFGGVRSRLARWSLAWPAICLLAWYSADFDRSLQPTTRGGSSVADHIARHRAPDDMVLCATTFDLFPLKYHARGRFPVYLARYRGLIVNHYHGSPILQEGDYLNWRTAVAQAGRRIWLVGIRPDLGRLAEPKGRDLLESTSFAESIPWRGTTAVELWERRDVAGGPLMPGLETGVDSSGLVGGGGTASSIR